MSIRLGWWSHRNVQRALAAIACLSLVLSLCVPFLRGHRDVFDVLAVLDITQSMNVLDYRLKGAPASRLAFAKHALSEGLLQLSCGSKLGLGVFSQRRTLVLFTPVEVCRNRAELMAAINALGGQMAWANASEIALGLHGALQIARELPDKPALMFITDGHEAPPVNPRYRPRFEGRPGEVHGFIVGAGGGIPRPIPKIGPDGSSLGFWREDEVAQTDLYSRGRAGSISGEQMEDVGGPTAPLPIDQPGGEEQLSSLHEGYLELLASETGLRYRALTDGPSLAAALTDTAGLRRDPAPVDVRWVWGTVALVALLTLSLPPGLPSLRFRGEARESAARG
jgi:mxaL protein